MSCKMNAPLFFLQGENKKQKTLNLVLLQGLAFADLHNQIGLKDCLDRPNKEANRLPQKKCAESCALRHN